MTMRKTVFVTADGKYFDTEAEANLHEMECRFGEAYRQVYGHEPAKEFTRWLFKNFAVAPKHPEVGPT